MNIIVPITGTVGAHYHTVGNEIVGQATNQNERVITIDGLLIADVFLADIDEAMSHFEVRSTYSAEMGRKLSNVMDMNIMKELALGARAAATITGGVGGTQIKNDKFKLAVGGAATVAEKAAALAAGIFAGAQALDEADAPDEGRYCVLRPAEYYALVQNKDAINKDWGGDGMYSDGTIWRMAGISILKANTVPKLDSSLGFYDPLGGTAWAANPEYNAYHIADCGQTVGLIWTPEAVGTVKLMDLSLQSEWDIRRQGTLMVARYAVGHDYLRPECCVELSLDALENTAASYDADGV